jgi:small subunit ribosomal protein S20
MANSKSSAKRALQNEKRRIRNRRYVSGSRTAVKKARTLLAGSDLDAAKDAVERACSELDRAAQKGVIHKRNASRRKSRLMLAYNRASQAAS